jgi:hypothetical protein
MLIPYCETGTGLPLLNAAPVANRIATMSQADREALRQTMPKEFGDCYDGTALHFPHSTNIVVASRS